MKCISKLDACNVDIHLLSHCRVTSNVIRCQHCQRCYVDWERTCSTLEHRLTYTGGWGCAKRYLSVKVLWRYYRYVNIGWINMFRKFRFILHISSDFCENCEKNLGILFADLAVFSVFIWGKINVYIVCLLKTQSAPNFETRIDFSTFKQVDITSFLKILQSIIGCRRMHWSAWSSRSFSYGDVSIDKLSRQCKDYVKDYVKETCHIYTNVTAQNS